MIFSDIELKRYRISGDIDDSIIYDFKYTATTCDNRKCVE